MNGLTRVTPRRAWGRSGFSAVVLGADGAGKSTLLEGLRENCPGPVTVVKVSVHSAAWAWTPGGLRWTVRSLRAAGVLVAARWRLARGDTVLWDRHPLEDPFTVREGRRVLGRGRRWLAPLAPAPDLVLLLDAPVEVLRSRRSEQGRAQLERLRTIYREIAAGHPHVVIDAAQHPDKVCTQATAAIEAHRGVGKGLPSQQAHRRVP